MFSWRRNPVRSSSEGEPKASFRQVVEQAQRGESEGLSALYRQFLPGIFGYIAARVPDRSTAEDLTSEVFLQMVEGIGQLHAREEPQCAAWLFQIARATIARYYRKAEKQPTLVVLDPCTVDETISSGERDDPAFWVEAREEWGKVVQAMNSLTEEQRLVLVGRLILGYDVATVAEMIGRSVNAVKAWQFRALNSLHRYLSQQEVSGDDASRLEKPGRRKR
jgi:RNA polymerase sigma-70 factor (ECF subfamily)